MSYLRLDASNVERKNDDGYEKGLLIDDTESPNDGGEKWKLDWSENLSRPPTPGFKGLTSMGSGFLSEDSRQSSRCSTFFRPFIILPGSATGRWWVEVWDLYIVCLVLVVAYLEPYSIALYDPGKEPWIHHIFNHVFNVSFTIDMVFNFFIATPYAQDSLHKELWEKDIRKLARNYVSMPCQSEGGRGGWFWLDLITLAPSWFFALMGETVSNPLLFLRIVRLFQSVRLQRLLRFGEICHSQYGFPLFAVEVFKFLAFTTLTCHWIACVWVLIEGKITHGLFRFQEGQENLQESWLSSLINAKGDCCTPNASEDTWCVYTLAYYWSMMTLTSVGYGDITPQNQLEYTFSIICMFIAGYTWAFIVGTIVSILSNLDPSNSEFKRSLDELGALMKRRGLSRKLQVKLRTYMYETRHFMQLYSQRQLVEQYFSDGLQREVARNSAEVREMLANVYWMGQLPEDAILDIVRGFRPKAFGPDELINLRGCMILMQRGLAGVKGRVIGRGDVWGHNDILMETHQLIDGSMPRTLSFVELLIMHKSTLIEVGRNYPQADRRLRRAQIRTAVHRAFVYNANRIKRTASRSNSMPDVGCGAGINSPSNTNMSNNMSRSVDGAESSFANPGMRRLHWRMEESTQRGTDLNDLRSLLEDVLARQGKLENHIAELHLDFKEKAVSRSSAANVGKAITKVQGTFSSGVGAASDFAGAVTANLGSRLSSSNILGSSSGSSEMTN